MSSQLKYSVPTPPLFFFFPEAFIRIAAWEVCGVEVVGVLGVLCS